MTTPLRDDYAAPRLRGEARKTKDGGQARRLLAPATIYDGSSHTEAAETGGVTLQIVRDWVLKFNAVGTGGLIDGKAPGKPALAKLPQFVKRQRSIRCASRCRLLSGHQRILPTS
jgi:transposase